MKHRPPGSYTVDKLNGIKRNYGKLSYEGLESQCVDADRLEKRIKDILSVVSRAPRERIPVSCPPGVRQKVLIVAYFSDKISADKIMAPHKKNNIERTKQFNGLWSYRLRLKQIILDKKRNRASV